MVKIMKIILQKDEYLKDQILEIDLMTIKFCSTSIEHINCKTIIELLH